MCRLFGFRSVILSQVHKSLISADNALVNQSSKHPDGWGVAFYVDGHPHVIKSTQSAITDSLFKKVSGIVSSQTVLAHIRNATNGNLSTLNTHPFQFAEWTFGHNGNIKNFDMYKPKLLNKIHPEFQKYILGETDSEVVFYFLLSFLYPDQNKLKNRELSFKEATKNIKAAINEFQNIVGSFAKHHQSDNKETFLTFILTDGIRMFAFQGGQPLFFTTYKKKCSERDTCPYLSESCEAPSKDGTVNHLILSSEPLHGENIWSEIGYGELIGIDEKMTFFQQIVCNNFKPN